MEAQKRHRSENWTSEEKEILRELVSKSAHTIENKSNNTNANAEKAREWKKITSKLNEICGKNRSDSEVKLSWKRMKLAAKANLSGYRINLNKTGGGAKPPSPSQEDIQIMSIAPLDFIVEVNDYDSDAVRTVDNSSKDIEYIEDGPRAVAETQINKVNNLNRKTDLSQKYNEYAVTSPSVFSKTQTKKVNPEINNTNRKSNVSKKTNEYTVAGPSSLSETHSSKATPEGDNTNRRRHVSQTTTQARETIVENNVEFKKRHLEMLEEEHEYKVMIAQLKIRKLELEISLLEKNNDNIQ